MYNAITIEERNKPTVSLVNKDFIPDSHSAASIKGMPGVRIVSQAVPCECTVKEKIEVGTNAVIDQIITALIKPLTAEEKSPSPKRQEEMPRIAFTGSIEEVNRFFYKRGWTDGLPIIPPTEEAVKEMLTGTDLAPDYLLGKVVSRFGKATVEKIAINAVLAGALPTYMPLLIAGVEAIVDPKPYLAWAAVGTGSHTPYWIINGPIRNDIRANKSSGYLSPGNMANATIGRAMALIIKNIGGNRQGIEDMGVHGNPGKYTMVAAENEEESPWEPLHVQEGFKKEDSAISLFCPDCFSQFWPYGTNEKGVMDGIIYNIIPARRGLTLIALPPPHAKTLAEAGWTKKDIVSFISEYARVPAHRHGDFAGGPRGAPAKEWLPHNNMDSMRILRNPDWIRLMVAGGPGNYVAIVQGGGSNMADWVTKKAKLPANWDKIVAKYKSVVPTHVEY